jgi:hypothetical protein
VPPYLELNWDYKPAPDWTFSLALKNPFRFTYVDSNTAYAGLRDTAVPLTTEELRIKSQARLYVEIRATL